MERIQKIKINLNVERKMMNEMIEIEKMRSENERDDDDDDERK